jgi:hypothetical protein
MKIWIELNEEEEDKFKELKKFLMEKTNTGVLRRLFSEKYNEMCLFKSKSNNNQTH